MQCRNCPSDTQATQAEFASETMIHFSGLRSIDLPGLLIFPKLLVCPECGSSWFTIPESKLAELAMCSPKSDIPQLQSRGP